MEFFIRKGATDPILKMRLIDDGKNDKSSFNDKLETATITFEMLDPKTGEYQILDSPCDVALRSKRYGYSTDEIYITYRFTSQQTLITGKFEGKINITFDDGNLLIVPVKEKLYINIIS
jgi:hypothetical protein